MSHYAIRKGISLFLMIFCVCLSLEAQQITTRIETEKDGFKWIYARQYDKKGKETLHAAISMAGDTLVPFKPLYYMKYALDGHFVLYRGDILNMKKRTQGLYSKDGVEIIPIDTGYNDISVSDRAIICYRNKDKVYTVYDLNGNKLFDCYDCPPRNDDNYGITKTTGEGDLVCFCKGSSTNIRKIYDVYGNVVQEASGKKGLWFHNNDLKDCDRRYALIPLSSLNLSGARFPNRGESLLPEAEQRSIYLNKIDLGRGFYYTKEQFYKKRIQGEDVRLPYSNVFCDSVNSTYYVVYNDCISELDSLDNEINPIAAQLYNQASSYDISDQQQQDKKKELLISILSFDKENKLDLKRLALYDLGVIAEYNGDFADAMRNYYAAYHLDKTDTNVLEAAEYAEKINNEIQKEQERLDRQQRNAQLAEALMGLANALGDANTAISTYKSSQSQRSNASKPTNIRTKTPISNKNSQSKKTTVSQVQNSRNAGNAYNGYVTQLIDMNTYPSRYNDSRRKQIQSSMKSIRERNNADSNNLHISKSEWEEWTGK